jgi:hypothetical protein
MTVNLCLKNLVRYLASIVMVAALAIPVGAQTVLLDFGNSTSFRGASVPNPDMNGNFWNSLQPGLFYSNLVDTTNTATTIDFGFSTGVGTDSFNGPAGVTTFPNPTAAEIAATDIDASALGILGIKEAAIDFAASDPNLPVRFEIQQLDPAKTYNLTFFGSHKFNVDNTTIYNVYTDNTYTTLVDSASLLVGVNGDHNRDTVASMSGLSPQASNILYVQFAGSTGNSGYLNALQISAVPEPSSLLLMASAAGLAFLNRRR